MNGITIYLEGGGNGRDTKVALRRGMDAFLGPIKQRARAKSLRWKIVPCGGRRQTFERFRDAVNLNRTQPDELVVLLVDAEAAVGNNTPRAHLQTLDNWDLAFAADDMVHLMVQVMETWIVADPNTLAKYYGSRFRADRLPDAANLETIPKRRIMAALPAATRRTQKGAYHKIRHASDILQRIDQRQIRKRCPACDRLFDTLERRIAAA